ncbi:hypothetical protein BC827DRAFT_1159214 [Russula dissimulans]|nr:hypothetical protein BC827DRAFT_1159214 [Russula dissimulans]
MSMVRPHDQYQRTRAQDRATPGKFPHQYHERASQDRTSAKELKEVGEGYHDPITPYFKEGFADGQNGRAELTQEPRTSVLTKEASTEEPLGKEARISAYHRKSPIKNSSKIIQEELDGATNAKLRNSKTNTEGRRNPTRICTGLAEAVHQRNNRAAKKGSKETQEQLAWPKRGSHKKEAPSYGEQDGAMDMKLRELRTNTEGQRNSNVQELMKTVDHNRRVYQEQPMGQEGC